MSKTLPQADLDDLARAKRLLEEPGLAIGIVNLLGSPVERLIATQLPKRATALVDKAADKAVTAAFGAALYTLDRKAIGTPARRWLHRSLTIGAGAVGGFFGWAGLAAELPITTTLILRSIADIAREHGEPPHDIATRLACIEVLALGGRTKGDDAAESGYFATRAALSHEISAVARHVAKHGIAEGGAPVVVRLIHAIASRFSVPVSQKLVAEAVPVLGAIAGAGLNAVFIAHFQAAAQGHFTVRRLERKHGVAAVQRAYATLGRED